MPSTSRRPPGRLDQPVDHLERGRLAAARRPDQHGDLRPRARSRSRDPTAGRVEPGKVLETPSSRMAASDSLTGGSTTRWTRPTAHDGDEAPTPTTTGVDTLPSSSDGQAAPDPFQRPIGPGHVLGQDGQAPGDGQPARAGQGRACRPRRRAGASRRSCGRGGRGWRPGPPRRCPLGGRSRTRPRWPPRGGGPIVRARAQARPPAPSGQARCPVSLRRVVGRRRTAPADGGAGPRSASGPRCGTPARSP